MNIKILFTIFLTISGLISAQNSQAGDTPIYRMNPNYDSTVAMFEESKIQNADIVMLGNSITHGGKWKRLFNRTNVEERGVPGDIIEGFIARIDQVIKLRPKLCLIMGGINDIYSGIALDTIFYNYKQLLELLKKNNIRPVIQSVLLAGSIYVDSEKNNKKVFSLNKLLSEYAKENEIDYIDLNKNLSVGDYLRNDVTFDGIHLNHLGYRIWAEVIEKVLRKYSL